MQAEESRHANMPAKITEQKMDAHANKRSAGILWSASAPPIKGDTKVHTGVTRNAAGTHSSRPRAFRMLVNAGTQKPGVMPWKKNTSHSPPNTQRGSEVR